MISTFDVIFPGLTIALIATISYVFAEGDPLNNVNGNED
tara:strand:- start:644 stop:760 length:117 start_codon:yes stop_codon:yes gene_type:complete